MNRIKELLSRPIFTYDSLPECWRIVLFGYEWIVPKKW